MAHNFKLKKEYFFLSLILLLSFVLNVYGLNWGLPSCWNTDQSVTTALNMLKDKTFLPQDYLHPSLYYYILIIFIAPYLLFQSVFYANFDSFLSASKISWNYMAINYPDLATGIFIAARLSSVLFSLLAVFLVYRIAKALHSVRAGLFSALILAVTMDFVNWAHMEKSVALVNLLILFSAYYAILLFRGGYGRREYFLYCILGGLSLSAKFNGGVTFLLIPIISLWRSFITGANILLKEKILIFLKTFFTGIIIYSFAFILTSPSILLRANKYYTESVAEYGNKLIPGNFVVLLKIYLINIMSIFESLVQMLGVPLALLAGCGLVYGTFKYCRRLQAASVLIYFPLITICSLALSPRIYLSANSKFIVQIVPFLAILGGFFTADLLTGVICKNARRVAVTIILAGVFVISFFYCFSLDSIFAYDDLRYHAGKWLKLNIPPGSNIIINNQLEYSITIEALKDYNIYVLGDIPGAKGAYGFIGGEYFNIDNNRYGKINSLSQAYVIRSCWQMKRNLVSTPLDALSGNLMLIKVFERKRPWYWNPGIGGYEPSRIEFYKRSV